MGRNSLEATKLLCNLIVRDWLDFLRGRPFFCDPDFADPLPLLDPVPFLAAVELGVFWGCAVEDDCAGNMLVCNSKPARIVAVKRLDDIVVLQFNPTRERIPASHALHLSVQAA
jgi:hypothetical protein